MKQKLKSCLEVTCSKNGKSIRFQMFVPFEAFQGLFRMIKLITKNDEIFCQISRQGIKPIVDLGKGGLSYDTRISSTEFEGLKPGEKQRYGVNVPMPLYIEAKEEK